jgi:P27 family predicted phage terminase small subunit
MGGLGLAGRPPKASALRVLEGKPGHRPLRNEPKTRPVAPKMPAWLLPEAKTNWRRLAPELERAGLLTAVDGAAFAACLQCYARWRAAETVLDELGMTITLASGYAQPRPEVAIAHKYLTLAAQLGARFGLTPSDRGRMTLPGVDDGGDDLLD